MPSTARSFRLHVLGSTPEHYSQGTLTIFAEYRDARAVARIGVTSEEIGAISEQAKSLRRYVEFGTDEFDIEKLERLGETLFSLVIRDNVQRLFSAATAQRSARIPLELLIESSTLASWPWEYMFDASSEAFICRQFHPISRNVFNLIPQSQVEGAEDKIQLLLISGSPLDPRVSTAEESELISRIFRGLLSADDFEITHLSNISPIELYRRLTNDSRWSILHFIGHSGYDRGRKEGYLTLERDGASAARIYASDLASALSTSRIRLAFLNSCETAREEEFHFRSRGSIASKLIESGISAVIANQFSVPNLGAHHFAGVVYNALLRGAVLGDAVGDGRNGLNWADKSRFLDWGIPVLFSKAPHQALFEPSGAPYREHLDEISWIKAHGRPRLGFERTPSPDGRNADFQSSLIVTKPTSRPSQVSVALVDLDAGAGFLPSLVEAANEVQDFYDFRVAYVPMPAGGIRNRFGNEKTDPQLFVPYFDAVAEDLPVRLGVNTVCVVTQNLLAGVDKRGREKWNYFLIRSGASPSVFFLSVHSLREYAARAGVPYEKAVLAICLRGMLKSDARWKLTSHKKTFGCLFDFCEDRDDIMVGLRKMKFDHMACRDKIGDPHQLAAIDALLALRREESNS